MAEMVTAREAAILLSGWPDYNLVQWHWRRGRLRQVRKSERVRLYFLDEVMSLARLNAKAK